MVAYNRRELTFCRSSSFNVHTKDNPTYSSSVARSSLVFDSKANTCLTSMTLENYPLLYAAILLFNKSFNVAPSSANFLIPSCNLSNAIWSCNNAHLNSGSSSTKVTFAIGSAWAAAEALSFWGTGSVEFLSCSRRAGAIVR